jgi:hypothetical protein
MGGMHYIHRETIHVIFRLRTQTKQNASETQTDRIIILGQIQRSNL